MPDDMRIPQRDDNQLRKDRIRTREQVDHLGEPRPGFRRIKDLDSILKEQHESIRDSLQFDIVDRQGQDEGDGRRRTFVARGQILVPVDPQLGTADAELTARNFTRIDLPAEEHQGVTVGDLVALYALQGTSETPQTDVAAAVAALTEQGVRAAPAMVVALHMPPPPPPPPPIVAKHSGGPAPTAVTVEAFTGDETSEDPILVAVIDTGIVEATRKDGWLNDVRRNEDGDNLDVLDIFPAQGRHDAPILDFAAGHGTFVAGIIRQVDRRARIKVYRVLDTSGLASEVDVARAMLRAADDGAQVINLSLGMPAVDDQEPCSALQAAVRQIRGRPNAPAIVASAGNYGSTDRIYPAALEGVLAVAALQAPEGPVDPNQRPEGAAWSSHGPWVDCSTVGEGIVSTFVKGDEDPQFADPDDPSDPDHYPLHDRGESWAVWSGTSFAAPQISGRIARYCREHGVSGAQAALELFPEGRGPTDGYGVRVPQLPGTPPA